MHQITQKEMRLVRLLIEYINLTPEEEVNQPVVQAEETASHNNTNRNDEPNQDSTVNNFLNLMTQRDQQVQTVMNEVVTQNPPQLTELVRRQPKEIEIVLDIESQPNISPLIYSKLQPNFQHNILSTEAFQTIKDSYQGLEQQFQEPDQPQKVERKRKEKKPKQQQHQPQQMDYQIKQSQQQFHKTQESNESSEEKKQEQLKTEKQIVFNAQEKTSKSKLSGEYPCPTCQKIFTFRSSLSRHRKEIHGYVPRKFKKTSEKQTEK